jgi:ubiquinol-cytochrome c reductase cytochrome c1 subunit
VYKEVCSACHGVKRVAYRNLSALGFSKAEIKAIAAGVEVEDGPDAEGKMFMRKGLPKDYILGPYPNENAARAANNGALPPDFSLIIKARNGGPRYVYGILTGYKEPPKTMLVDAGRYYNLYYPGHMIAMPPPLHDKGVVYTDGTVASVDQMAKDVVAFLSFAAEPELEERKQLGIKVILYLMLTTVLFYFTMRRIWKRVH